MAKDYYNILGVGKSASADEIKKAFRKLAHEHHPDKTTGDEAKFKEINEAYQVLGNTEKRQQYDQYGQTFSGAGSNGGGGFGGQGGNPFGQGFGGFQQGGANFDFGDLGDMGDLFGSFFGGGRPTHNVGRDLETEITIEFLESVFGVEKTIDLNKQIKCDHCSGSGAEPGAKINTCKTCNGSGRVVKIQQTILGRMQMQGVCDSCQGQGQIPDKKCQKCGGAGHISGRDKIKVSIPAGIASGQQVKLSGKGEPGDRGRFGDLYIRINVRTNNNFVRRGDDILSDAHISIKQAILGDKITVKTVDGDESLKILEGTASKSEFRLKGKGVPHLRERGRGDHIVTVVVDIPKSLNREQRKLVEQLDI